MLILSPPTPHPQMLSYVGYAILLVLSSSAVNAQENVVGSCSLADLVAFLGRVPDGASCGPAVDRFFMPGPSQDDIDSFCKQACGGAFADFANQNCDDLGAATATLAYCLSPGFLEPGPDRCRSAAPDLLEGSIVENLQTCLAFDPENGMCPDGCEDALAALVDAAGCCYRLLLHHCLQH